MMVMVLLLLLLLFAMLLLMFSCDSVGPQHAEDAVSIPAGRYAKSSNLRLDDEQPRVQSTA